MMKLNSHEFGLLMSATERQMLKHLIDVVICVLFLPFILLAMVVCAIAVYLDSGRPIFFVQDRIGKDGHLFRMYKFRTMYANLDTTQHRAFMKAFVRGDIGNEENPSTPTEGKKVSSGPNIALGDSGTSSRGRTDGGKREGQVYKPAQTSQITRVGRFLRKTSLDELPQVLNVLKGEMSLVGPRPNVPYEVEEYQLWHSERLEVLPGMTGLAQVKGRSSLSFGRIVKYDIEYIEEQSLVEDLRILFRTVLSVFSRKGAK